MRVFHCDHCGQCIFFENTLCGSCGNKLAYLADLQVMASLDPSGDNAPDADPTIAVWTSPIPRAQGRRYRLCKNYAEHGVCNWAVPEEQASPFCQSCQLTTIIPDLSDPANIPLWLRLEAAKRRLVYSMMHHRLPLVSKNEDQVKGLAFHFLSDKLAGTHVLTGHDSGLITMNIAEADDVERERRRVSLHEPYRTLLGHFRHEIGHYYWDLLVQNSSRAEGFRQIFGDERADYDEALRNHYAKGATAGWQNHFVSEYASVHPWEDWAETWAHYLHMTDTLETAAVCGVSLHPDRADEPVMEKQPTKPAHEQSFDEIIGNWFPLTYVLNSLNRGMGLPDAYPFVLPPPALEKLRFVHETICQVDCLKKAGSTTVAA